MSVIKIRNESGEFVDIPVIKGEKGEDGPSNVLTIGSVTSGATASATITGESPNQVLNLVLPKGDKGDTGARGEDGQDGADGIQGSPGKDGINGVSPNVSVKVNNATQYILTITDAENSFDTPNLKGQNGSDGQNGADGTSVSVIEATDENNALTLSAQNPNNIYFWEE